MDAILDRFLRYVAFPTTSAEGAAVWPSSPGQRDLGSALAAELAAMGLRANQRVLPPHIVKYLVEKFCIDL